MSAIEQSVLADSESRELLQAVQQRLDEGLRATRAAEQGKQP